MPGLKRQLYRAITYLHLTIDNWLYRLRLMLGLGTNAPIIVVPYPSYGTKNYVYIQGRVLKEKQITSRPDDSDWKTLKNNFKRAWSVEIRNATLEITIEENSFIVITDKEGYFKLDSNLENPLSDGSELWRKANIKLVEVPWRKVDFEINCPFIVPGQSSFGVISDIDDTIIETKVNSVLKLEMIYLAFFKTAAKRLAFDKVSAFYRALHQGGKIPNPIFYVSKSPWNISDHIEAFLLLNKLPLGPLLLRDYGLPYISRPLGYRGHKYENIQKILQTYQELPFILIGDSGEKDLEIYTSIADQFPGKVLCIFIHDVRKKYHKEKNRSMRINDVPVFFIDHYGKAAEIAAKKGWINEGFYQTLLPPG